MCQRNGEYLNWMADSSVGTGIFQFVHEKNSCKNDMSTRDFFFFCTLFCNKSVLFTVVKTLESKFAECSSFSQGAAHRYSSSYSNK